MLKETNRQIAFITSTFCHLRGISADRERALWKSGVVTWDDLEKKFQPQLSLFTSSHHVVLQELERSRRALDDRQLDYFAQKLPKREHYRLAYAFPEDTVFLDIETTGLSRYYDYITLVGLSRGNSYHVHVRGSDPQCVIDAITCAKVLVTFNGTLFDVPFLLQEFPGIRLPTIHVDLRFLARRVGLTGGQKDLEQRLSIKRAREIATVRGDSAPVLWHKFRRGDEEALRTLMLYNHADIQGMKAIFDVVGGRLVKNLRIPLTELLHPKFAKQELYLDCHREVEQVRQRFGGRFPPLKRTTTIADLHTNRKPFIGVVGIDLTGSEKRASGWSYLWDNEALTSLIHSDEEIIARTLEVKPDIVSIDSPLSLPTGFRLTAKGVGGAGDIMRFCERALKKRGVNAYPALIPSMRNLTARGIRLANKFRSYGIPTIESYPGAAQDVMNIPRKRASLELLKAGLAEFGVLGAFLRNTVTHDELDAITSAVVGLFFWSGRFERLGPKCFGDEALIIPDLKASPVEWNRRVVIGLSGPLAAGKTTAAQALQCMGLHYARYSMVVEDSLRRLGHEPTRTALQDEGKRLHKTKGQRWLGARLLEKLPADGNYVIDGLRFPEDHAFLREMFGPAFVHVHVSTPLEERKRRYVARSGTEAEFDEAERHDVESKVAKLASLADVTLTNVDSLENFTSSIQRFAQSLDGVRCQLQ